MRDFRKLKVWQEARVLVKKVYELTSQLPETETYGLASQLKGCVISVSSNIAEGSATYSQKEFVRYLQISLGSSYELETQLLLCADLQFINATESDLLIKRIQLLQKRISSLIKYYKSTIYFQQWI